MTTVIGAAAASLKESDLTAGEVLHWTSAVLLAVLVLATGFVAWLIERNPPYTAGSNLGYNLGLVGGLMMLSLLLYPLRKRLRVFERLGEMPNWFRYHMVVGVLGPVLVLFHSTFRIGSMNGGVALYSMLLVAVSGVVGRFVYRHVHQGLYGQQLTLADCEKELQISAEGLRSVFTLRPDIGPRLISYRDAAFRELDGVGPRLWRFMTLRWRGHRLANAIRQDAKRVLRQKALRESWSRGQRILAYQLAKKQVLAYIDAVCQSSQLAVWERLFSLWHAVHVPFLYLLVASGIAHVVAVHMY